MSASKILRAAVPREPAVPFAIVRLADGRVVARAIEELTELPLEDQAAVAAQLGVAVPPGRAS